ncbi:Activated RNA polymerase II transcriptional coactivator p15 [Geodia barretti]|uniref:Activated RNA polymerase II transcriptional coactivator p15 n=1 Tax=Geodia barretti TaxID=519541 RepID=A0AA35T385_GEOBA|nr:Activated RNA polymerase II transcriptional coactivator p15 [Geodia barretti]
MSKRTRKPVSQEFIDDSDDPDDTGAKTKKVKKAEAAVASADSDDDMIEISNKRFVNVRVYNGRFLVDIREYWYDDGVRKPGKKGISLTVEQWGRLKEAIPQIDAKIGSTSK